MNAVRMLAPVRGRLDGIGAAWSAAARFRSDLLPHRRELATAFGVSLLFTAAELAQPWPLKVILDNVVTGAPVRSGIPLFDTLIGAYPRRLLSVAVATLLFLAWARGVAYYHRNVISARVGQSVVMRVRRRLFAHLQRLSLDYHHQASTGDLLVRLTGDIILLRDLLVASLLTLVSETVIVVGYLVVMFLMSWRLALLSSLALPVLFVLVTVYSSRIRHATRRQRKRESKLASRVHEVLNGIHVVKMFARERDEDDRLRQLSRLSLKSGLRTTRLEARMHRSVELSIASATAIALWFGALEVIGGWMSVGELIVYVFYMRAFYRPLRRISRVVERASKAGTCVERIAEVLDVARDVPDGEAKAPLFDGAIELEGVTCAYGAAGPVLRDVDLTVPSGQTVALVGPSGAGKSTLIGLLIRLRDPRTGTVRIDKLDIRDFVLSGLRDQIAVVPQDGMLFSGTIRENIAYGRLDASDEEVEQAARAARIHEMISGLPEGYETHIGERGATLSGGQAQRISIARAIVRDAPIVLLDEPTTGLDPETEVDVVAAMRELLRGRTALVVAHRRATLRLADRIVMLEAGRIVADGSEDDLLDSNARFTEFVSAGTVRGRVGGA